MPDGLDFFELWDAASRRPEPERTPLASVASAGDITPYVDRVCQGVTIAVNGTRNDTLNRAAYTLGRIVAAGQLDYTTAAEALAAAGRAAGLEDGEITATVRSGLRSGEREPRALEKREVVAPPVSVISLSSAPPAPPDDTQPETERTSWWPRRIGEIVLERAEEPPPTQLARQDGHRLFYAGRVNGLLGESESGKTWVALLAVQQALAVGEHVLYLDFEDSAKGIETRLTLIGATRGHLERLHYASPDEALGLAQQADLAEALGSTPYTVIVVDGVNAAMTLMGLDVDSSNRDATVFTQRILRPLADTGAAVITIDHVPKNKDARGKGGIGAQAKRAMTRGCALAVEIVRPFGEGQVGELKLTVDKDTPGKVRGVSAGGKVAGAVHIDSTQPGKVDITIEAPDLRSAAEKGPFRPTHLMAKVSAWLETVPEGASGASIEKGVGGNRDYIREALNALVTEGHVTRSSGPRGAVVHTLINPFQEL